MSAAKNGKARKRSPISAPERLKLWVRSGGRCCICNRYLLEGALSYRELTFGELAHVVGQQASAGSPRGLAVDLDRDHRDQADNLVLLCDDEHDELDKLGSRDLFSVEFIRARKRRHEERVHHVTGFGEDRATTILRVIGNLRGNAVEISRETAAAAVIRSAERFPRFSLAYDRHSIEIDLRQIPGEADADDQYYRTATARIDEVLNHKLNEGVAREEIAHLSVFAFARLPLLVYLGAHLDDNVPTEVYQRHRSTEGWEWPHPVADVAFRLDVPAAVPDATEGVLVLNVSGSIQSAEVPAKLVELPRFLLAVDGVTPAPDVLQGPRALGSFTDVCRQLLAAVEAGHKQLQLLHVFAAIPLSAAVTLGRVFDPAVHPNALIYDRTSDGYLPALRVGAR